MSELSAVVGLDALHPEEWLDHRGAAGVSPGYVVFVGVGGGDVMQLTLGAVKAIAEAQVAILAPGVDPGLLEEPEIEHQPDLLVVQAPAKPSLEKVIALSKGGAAVVWLVPGDALLDGHIGGLCEELADNGIPFDLAHGMSRMSLAHSTAGIPAIEGAWWWSSPTPDGECTIMVMTSSEELATFSDKLIAAGATPTTPVLVSVNHGTRAQRSFGTVVNKLARAAADVEPGLPVAVFAGHRSERDPRFNWFESKPLFGWRILVPRTKGRTGVLERRLEHHGAIPVKVLTLSVEPPRNPQPLERAVQGLVDGRFQWIVFNSPNSVRAIIERLSELGLDARAFSGLRIAAVGDDTVAALEESGITPELVPDGDQVSEALAEVFPMYDELLDPINRVLVPRAEVAVDSLVTGLSDLGWEVEDVVAFRTVRAAPPSAEIREGIKTGRYDAAVFTSASSARNLVGIAGKPHNDTIIAAIGPATVASCQEHGLRVDVVPDEPGQIELADALAAFAVARREAMLAEGKPYKRPSQRRARRRRATA